MCASESSLSPIVYSNTIDLSYKEFNTPARLGELTDSKLLSLGVSDKEDRRLVLAALNAAGYRSLAVTNAKHHEAKKRHIAIANRTPGAQGKDDDGDGEEGDDGISPSPKSGGDSSTVITHPRLAAAPEIMIFMIAQIHSSNHHCRRHRHRHREKSASVATPPRRRRRGTDRESRRTSSCPALPRTMTVRRRLAASIFTSFWTRTRSGTNLPS